MNVSTEFQRARRPEQQEARRQAILTAAAEMLAESPVNEISLRELSRRVGLAKSNVLRYFESREAVFLELLDSAWRQWLEDLAVQLEEGGATGTDNEACEKVGGIIARSLAARPLLCELTSVLAGVLERNISVEVARRFKIGAAQNSHTFARLVHKHVPGLDDAGAEHFSGATIVMVAGLWPLSNPCDTVKAAVKDLDFDMAHLSFVDGLREGLTVHLIGLLNRTGAVTTNVDTATESHPTT